MKPLLVLITLYGSCFLADCSGNSAPPPPISVQTSPAALALDLNQSGMATATVSNAPGNQSFDWALSCSGGKCGTIAAHTASSGYIHRSSHSLCPARRTKSAPEVYPPRGADGRHSRIA